MSTPTACPAPGAQGVCPGKEGGSRALFFRAPQGFTSCSRQGLLHMLSGELTNLDSRVYHQLTSVHDWIQWLPTEPQPGPYWLAPFLSMCQLAPVSLGMLGLCPGRV